MKKTLISKMSFLSENHIIEQYNGILFFIYFVVPFL